MIMILEKMINGGLKVLGLVRLKMMYYHKYLEIRQYSCSHKNKVGVFMID